VGFHCFVLVGGSLLVGGAQVSKMFAKLIVFATV
jgi:hypothetical protein